jgi:hypothetical protein
VPSCTFHQPLSVNGISDVCTQPGYSCWAGFNKLDTSVTIAFPPFCVAARTGSDSILYPFAAFTRVRFSRELERGLMTNPGGFYGNGARFNTNVYFEGDDNYVKRMGSSKCDSTKVNWDAGHMLFSALFSSDLTAMKLSNAPENFLPEIRSFNTPLWSGVEKAVRAIIASYSNYDCYIWVGPLYKGLCVRIVTAWESLCDPMCT